MLTIRLQRTGRSGTAMFRVVVQDSRQTPTSGKVVALLGSYNPHSKDLSIDSEKAAFYLEHGAQPSPRVGRLLKEAGVKLPEWAAAGTTKQGKVRNADKRRSTRPAVEAAAPEAPEAKAEEAPAEAEPTTEAEAPAAQPAAESVAEPEAPAEQA